MPDIFFRINTLPPRIQIRGARASRTGSYLVQDAAVFGRAPLCRGTHDWVVFTVEARYLLLA